MSSGPVFREVADRPGLLCRPARFLQLHQHGSLLVAVCEGTNNPIHRRLPVLGLPVLEDAHIDLNLCLTYLGGWRIMRG